MGLIAGAPLVFAAARHQRLRGDIARRRRRAQQRGDPVLQSLPLGGRRVRRRVAPRPNRGTGQGPSRGEHSRHPAGPAFLTPPVRRVLARHAATLARPVAHARTAHLRGCAWSRRTCFLSTGGAFWAVSQAKHALAIASFANRSHPRLCRRRCGTGWVHVSAAPGAGRLVECPRDGQRGGGGHDSGHTEWVPKYLLARSRTLHVGLIFLRQFLQFTVNSRNLPYQISLESRIHSGFLKSLRVPGYSTTEISSGENSSFHHQIRS